MIRYDEPDIATIGRYEISEAHHSYGEIAPIEVHINIHEPQEDLEIHVGTMPPPSMSALQSVNALQYANRLQCTRRSAVLERILGITALFKAVDVVSYTPDNLEDIKVYIQAYNEFQARTLKMKKHFPDAIIAPTTRAELEIVRNFIERYGLLKFSEYSFVNLIYRFGLDNNDVLKFIIDNVNNPEVREHYQNLLYKRNKNASEIHYG